MFQGFLSCRGTVLSLGVLFLIFFPFVKGGQGRPAGRAFFLS